MTPNSHNPTAHSNNAAHGACSPLERQHGKSSRISVTRKQISTSPISLHLLQKPRVPESSITCPATLSRAALLDFLKKLDHEFNPPLSGRTDLEKYATKLTTLATFATASTTKDLTGLAAMYCNDIKNRVAYVSLAGVLPAYRGTGIGRSLLSACASFARSKGMSFLALQADANEVSVIQFYQKLGFAIVETYTRFQNSVAHRLELDLLAPKDLPSST